MNTMKPLSSIPFKFLRQKLQTYVGSISADQVNGKYKKRKRKEKCVITCATTYFNEMLY